MAELKTLGAVHTHTHTHTIHLESVWQVLLCQLDNRKYVKRNASMRY